jgi:hypothetical protein
VDSPSAAPCPECGSLLDESCGIYLGGAVPPGGLYEPRHPR